MVGLIAFVDEASGSKAGKMFLAAWDLDKTKLPSKWLNTATAEGSLKSSIGRNIVWNEVIEPSCF